MYVFFLEAAWITGAAASPGFGLIRKGREFNIAVNVYEEERQQVPQVSYPYTA